METYLQLLPKDIIDSLKPYLAKEKREDCRKIIKSILRPSPSYISYILRGSYLGIIGMYLYIPARAMIYYNGETLMGSLLIGCFLIPGLVMGCETIISDFTRNEEENIKKRANKLIRYLTETQQ